jgi:hypothetical protein
MVESRTGLRGLPSLTGRSRPSNPEGLLAEAVRVASRLAARATLGHGVLAPSSHADVALELRDLFPLIEDDVFDHHLARLDRAARFVSSAETADADDTAAYDEAAWEAGLDPADFAGDVEGFRDEVIEHWDLALLEAVADLVTADGSSSRFADRGNDVRAG